MRFAPEHDELGGDVDLDDALASTSPLMMLLALLLSQPTPSPLAADFDERLPLLVIISNPGNLRSAVPNPDLFAGLVDVLEDRARVRPTFLDGFRSSCNDDLKCLLSESGIAKLTSPPMVLWVSSRGSQDGTRVAMTVLSATVAVPMLTDASRTSGDMLDAATVTVTNVVVVRRSEEVRPRLADAIEQLGVAFSRAGAWGAVGSVNFVDLPAAAWVQVGTARRRIAPDLPRVDGLAPGSRRLLVEADGYDPVIREIVVVAGQAVIDRPTWFRKPTAGVYVRYGTAITGGVVAVAGGVALGVALSQRSVTCISDGNGSCPSVIPPEASWTTAMMIGGATAAAGSLIVGDEFDIPWISWIVGAVAATATFAIVEAVR